MHQLGLTRSANRRDHLLQTPDTFIRTPLPGLTSGSAIVHVSPQRGAGFTMMTVEFDADGSMSAGPTQRFLYVLEGHLQLDEQAFGGSHDFTAGSYAYLPQGQNYRLTAAAQSRAIVIDKPFQPLNQHASRAMSDAGESNEPCFLTGAEPDILSTALNGDEGLQVRALLPPSIAFDFACNTMSYEPGASLSQVEIHYMEHGLLMLQGGGMYRLGDDWHPTQAGDFIWMGPYCPQSFYATGPTPARYLYYKNVNREIPL